MKRIPPVAYDDPLGTVTRAGHLGYEVVQKPDRAIARKTLSSGGRQKHERAAALQKRGWDVISLKGSGMVANRDDPEFLASIAAAAKIEGLS